MAILSRDEFFTRLQEQIGEDTSDRSISFLEDMTDTFNDMENRSNGDGVDWEQKYKELDESWKKKYRHRFFTGGGGNVPEPDVTGNSGDEYDPDDITVEDLFTKKEVK